MYYNAILYYIANKHKAIWFECGGRMREKVVLCFELSMANHAN